MLDYIKMYISGLNKLQKIQLYAIPLLFCIFIIYNNPINKEHINTKRSANNVYQNNINNLKKRLNSANIFDILKGIENISRQSNVEIENITNNKRIITLDLKGKFNNIHKFLFLSENLHQLCNLKKININKKNKSLICNIEFEIGKVISTIEKDTRKYFQTIQKIKNPYIQKQNNKMVLKAVIGDFVQINKKLLQEKQIYNGYKIIKIENNFIELEKDGTIKKLEIFKYGKIN